MLPSQPLREERLGGWGPLSCGSPRFPFTRQGNASDVAYPPVHNHSLLNQSSTLPDRGTSTCEQYFIRDFGALGIASVLRKLCRPGRAHCHVFLPKTRLSISAPTAKQPRWFKSGPATTEIASPHLRGRRRLNCRCLFHLPRALPLTSMRGNSLEIDVGIEWESGNWTGIP
jgi:hypothetical protein